MIFNYYTKGTCSRQITLDINENDIIENVRFIGGCSGNLQGISKLIQGMKIDDVIERTKGTICRNGTSCPDQLAQALIAYKESKNQ